jgi:hypothetical protein
MWWIPALAVGGLLVMSVLYIAVYFVGSLLTG